MSIGLAEFRKLNKKEQKITTQKELEKIKKTQLFLEENGTFTFYDPKKNGGLSMEYIPNKK